MADLEKLYQERLNRILTAASHKEPDSVPVVHLAQSWNIGYSGLKAADVQDDVQKAIESFSKPFERIYADGTFLSALTIDVNIRKPLGGEAYFFSSDGVTIQHKEYVFMRDDDYPALIKDPMQFTVNEIFSRKYPSLNKPYPQNLEALRESHKAYGMFLQKMMGSVAYAKEVYGIPTLVAGGAATPFDLIMDFYRGISGMMGDIRRRPEQVKEACKAIMPVIMKTILRGRPSLTPFPYVFLPLHAPTFLNIKQFEEFYWPTFREVLYNTAELGGKCIIFLEGNWEHLYEYINNFPKDFAICILEKDDIFKAKEKIGDTVTIAGGIGSAMLRAASKQKCIDHVKAVVDKCSPGGGYIFTYDGALLTPGDANIETLVAVNEFVHNYKG